MSLSKGLASERALQVLKDSNSGRYLPFLCDCFKAPPASPATNELDEGAGIVEEITEAEKDFMEELEVQAMLEVIDFDEDWVVQDQYE